MRIKLQHPEKTPVKPWKTKVVAKLSTDTGCLLESREDELYSSCLSGVQRSYECVKCVGHSFGN